MRLTRVERRIIACARNGEEADFRKERVRPRVSGRFLARLMSGHAGYPVHQRGLLMSGLIVEGPVELDDIRTRRDGGEMPGFAATSCAFDSFIDLIAARIDWLRLERCTIAGGECHVNRFALRIEAATLSFGIFLDSCSLNAAIAGDNARIGHDVQIQRTRVAVEKDVVAISFATPSLMQMVTRAVAVNALRERLAPVMHLRH